MISSRQVSRRPSLQWGGVPQVSDGIWGCFSLGLRGAGSFREPVLQSQAKEGRTSILDPLHVNPVKLGAQRSTAQSFSICTSSESGTDLVNIVPQIWRKSYDFHLVIVLRMHACPSYVRHCIMLHRNITFLCSYAGKHAPKIVQ